MPRIQVLGSCVTGDVESLIRHLSGFRVNQDLPMFAKRQFGEQCVDIACCCPSSPYGLKIWRLVVLPVLLIPPTALFLRFRCVAACGIFPSVHCVGFFDYSMPAVRGRLIV